MGNYNVLNHTKQGGAVTEIGGTLNLAAGHTFQFNDATAFLALAVAAGYKIARGIVTPTSASHTVVTGLATVVAAVAVLTAPPTVTHMFTQANIGNQTGAPAAGSILIVSQKPTAVNDVTPVASSSPWGSVAWIAVGT